MQFSWSFNGVQATSQQIHAHTKDRRESLPSRCTLRSLPAMTTLSDDGSCPPSAPTRAAIAAVTTAQREAPATALASKVDGRHLQRVHVSLSIRLSPCSESLSPSISNMRCCSKVPYGRLAGDSSFCFVTSYYILTLHRGSQIEAPQTRQLEHSIKTKRLQMSKRNLS